MSRCQLSCLLESWGTGMGQGNQVTVHCTEKTGPVIRSNGYRVVVLS